MTKLAIPHGVSLAQARRRLSAPSFWWPSLNSDGAVLASSSRPTITATASGTPHAKGAWQEVVAATTEDANWVAMWNATTTGANLADTSMLLDIGVGAAGSEVVIVPNLPVGYGLLGRRPLGFPVRIPKGSRVAIRAQSVVASATAGFVFTFGELPHGKRAPAALVAMGANTATSRGVSIAGAAVNTKSSWVEITAATSQPFGALLLGLQGDADTALAAGTGLVDVGVGAAGSEVVVLADFYVSFAVAEQVNYDGGRPIVPASIPAGSRLAVRWARDNTGNSIDAILHGVPIT